MTDRYYPKFDPDTLEQLKQLSECVGMDPTYLEEADEYPTWLLDLLGGVEEAEAVRDDLEEVDLVKETTGLFRGLQDAKDGFATDDHSERMSYFRTSTALLEKLVGLKERALNIRQISRFYQTVLAVMEEVLEPGQVTEVRERLKEYEV